MKIGVVQKARGARMEKLSLISPRGKKSVRRGGIGVAETRHHTDPTRMSEEGILKDKRTTNRSVEDRERKTYVGKSKDCQQPGG